jgi:hypothetical protein
MTSENGQPKHSGRSVFRNVDPSSFVYEWQETSDDGATWETVATRTFTRRVTG